MKKSTSIILTLVGLLLLAAGLILLKVQPDMAPISLPYVLIGIGSGTFGCGFGEFINRRVTKNHPELAKQIEIEKNDERNLSISNKAKAKAYDCMVYVYGALMLCFTLMMVDLQVVLLFVLSYLIVIGYGVFYRIKLDKEM